MPRIAVACGNCHKAKSRCDGGLPCRRCLDRNMSCDCTYLTRRARVNNKSLDTVVHDVAANTSRGRGCRATPACEEYRRRRTKCDRLLPCSECSIQGTPSDCTYITKNELVQCNQQATLANKQRQSSNDLRSEGSKTPQWSPSMGANEVGFVKPSTRGEGMYSPHNTPNGITRDGCAGQSSATELFLPSGRETDEFQRNPTWLITQSIQQLLDQFNPQNYRIYGGTTVLQDTLKTRPPSPILSVAFEATSLIFWGRRVENKTIELAGHTKYNNVIEHLRKMLSSAKETPYELLVVIFLCAIIEVFKRSSDDFSPNHLLGGLEILRVRTPHRHRQGIERLLFVDLRLHWVTAALVRRQPTFLASEEWLTVPWLEAGSTKDTLQLLLDIAVDVPAYLSQIDAGRDRQKKASQGITSFPEISASQDSMENQAMQLHYRLNTWKRMYVDDYPSGIILEEPGSQSTDGFPVLRCRDVYSMKEVIPTVLVYPDTLLATSMCLYWALSLVISATDNVLAAQDRYGFACNICRSMKHYVKDIPSCIVLHITFAIQTAYNEFADSTVEKDFIEQFATYAAKNLGVPIFRGLCDGTSSGLFV